MTDHKNTVEAYITDVKNAAELEIDSKKTVTLTSVTTTIDAAVATATNDINTKSVELQTAAAELSSAASLANTQAVNSSLFTMLALSGL